MRWDLSEGDAVACGRVLGEPGKFGFWRTLLVLALLFSTLTLSAVEKKPNFIVVLADDLGAGELGCYGNRKTRTPNLDRLAAEGMRFETCYATPLCTPTRVALMTGQYGFRTGYFNLRRLPFTPREDSPEYEIGKKLTFAHILKTNGYATALAGKWQLPGKHPTLIHDCGFDEYRMWAYLENLPADVKHTGRFEDAQGKSHPVKPARYWHPCIVENGKYLPTKPDDYGPDLFNNFVIDFVRRHQDGPFCVYFTQPLTHPPHEPTPDPEHPGQKLPGGMKSNVEYLDHLMGRLVRAVDQLGLKENTIIIFIGDNGTAGHGKGSITEIGVRVPLIVRCPGTVKAGVVSRELTDITDLLPTLLSFAGAKAPPNHKLDGASLVPTLRGVTNEHRPWIFSFLAEGRLLRDKRWLLVDAGKGQVKLFDCGESRDGTGYQDVSDSRSADVLAARKRFETLLQDLPGPENHPGLKLPEPAGAGKAAKRKPAADE